MRLMVDLENQLDRRDALLRMRELERANPLPTNSDPGSASVRRSLAIAQQILAEPVFGAQLFFLRLLVRPLFNGGTLSRRND
jgi:hypothetical protein